MVSADKYFRNKKLTTVFKAMDDLKGCIKDLRKAKVRLASDFGWQAKRLEDVIVYYRYSDNVFDTTPRLGGPLECGRSAPSDS